MSDTIRSPQADIIDTLVWDRLSTFWTKYYDSSDKEALNAVYEGTFQVLDAEYVRLFEINSGKSVVTAPINSQRRWLRLDLNRHAELDAFLKFLANDAVTGSTLSNNVNSSDTLDCAPNIANHARHWHIQFPYTVPSGDALSRSTIDLFYPTELSLVTIHKMVIDSNGRLSGLRLKPGIDYVILANRTSIRLTSAQVGDKYEYNVAFDFSKSTYDGLKAEVSYTSGIDRIASNIIPIPASLSQANLPVHALVVSNVVDTGTGGLIESNNSTFSTTYQFIPWTGSATGPQYGSASGQLVLPSSVLLGPNDSVFVFGLIRGEWDIAHRHELTTTFLNPGAVPGHSGVASAGSTDTIEFNTLIKPGFFKSLGYLGQTLEVYLNGRLLNNSEFRIGSDNKLVLRSPVSWNSDEFVTVDVRFSDEYETIQTVLGDQHVHFVCSVAVATPRKVFATFDDGGDFDENPSDVFDDTVAINVLFISDVLANLATLEVFVDGRHVERDVDYTAATDPVTGRIQLSFTAPIDGKSIVVTYRRDVRTFIYGDFATNNLGTNRATLSGLLTDVQGLIASFGSSYNFNSQNVGRLVEAAAVAAAGGNPFLTLFFDEYEEYIGLPIDAAGQFLTSFDARNVESYSTQLTSIPFLTDHVLHPTVRLQEGKDYDVTDGRLLSSIDLLAPRGASDAQPGIWWCPVVLLDEQFLAKNFGALVGDIRESSIAYKQALTANFSMRFGGPTVQNLEWSLAVMLGSPAFTQDGTVVSTNQEFIGYRITVGNDSTQQTEFIPATKTPLPVGIAVVPTQSLTEPPIYDGTLVMLRSASDNQIVLDTGIRNALPGDVVRLTIFDPNDLSHTPILFATTLVSSLVDVDYLLPRTTLVLKDTPRFTPTANSTLLILRQAGAPFSTVSGSVLSVTPVLQTVVKTQYESFKLPENAVPEYRPGNKVFRGEPLFPSYAVIYDNIRRPTWNWITPADFRASWNYAARGLGSNVVFLDPIDTRLGTVSPPVTTGGYSELVLTPAQPIPLRGAKIDMIDDVTNDTLHFTVVGDGTSGVLVTPTVSTQRSGNCTVTGLTRDSIGKYFESASPPQSALIETTLTHPQLIDGSSLQVVDTTDFPDAGHVAVILPNGGSTEFTYNAKGIGFFLDCEWPADFPALTGKLVGGSSPFNPTLPQDSILRLVSAFTTRRVNPAFVSLVDKRAERDLTTNSSTVQITDDNAEALFDLMKTGSVVFESRAVTKPAAVINALEELTPTGSTLVVVSKHVVVDTYTPKADDRVQQFHQMSLIITPAPVAGDITLPNTATTVTLSVSIIDPDSASPYTYLWEQQPFQDLSVVFGTPAAASTTFHDLVAGGAYYIRVTVTNQLGRTASSSFRILVNP